MAKVHFPLLSGEASGSVAGITYCRRNGVDIAKSKIMQNTSASAAQETIRDDFKMAVAAWQAETAPNKALWVAYATAQNKGISGYAYYVGAYVKFLVANAGTPPTVTNTPPVMG